MLNSGKRPVARVRAGVVAAAVGLLVVAGIAVATTGGESPGTVIPPAGSNESSDNKMNVPETVLASGVAQSIGRWRLTSFESEGIVHHGETLEERGAPCIRLMVESPVPDAPMTGSGYCSEPGVAGEFTMASVPVAISQQAGETLLFGRVPGEAAGVELVAGDGQRIRGSLHDSRGAFAGFAWVIVAPNAVEEPSVRWLKSDGSVAASQEASSRFPGAAGQ